jgi:hypothetical protein
MVWSGQKPRDHVSQRRPDMSKFRAVVIEKDGEGQTVSLKNFCEADLMDGDVTIRVTHSIPGASVPLFSPSARPLRLYCSQGAFRLAKCSFGQRGMCG